MHLDGETYTALTWPSSVWERLASSVWLVEERERARDRERNRERRAVATLRRGPRRKAGPKIGSVAGERNPAARLTASQVADIRRALDEAKGSGQRGALVAALRTEAERFRVSEATVKAIRAGRLWKAAA